MWHAFSPTSQLSVLMAVLMTMNVLQKRQVRAAAPMFVQFLVM
jgi:hypothetical protein